MAYFAKISNSNIVEEIIVISNCAIGSCIGPDHWDYQEEYHKDHNKKINFLESEALGQKVILELGFEGNWLQTSYNASFRGKFAGTGDIWDGTNFVSPAIQEPDASHITIQGE